MFLRPRLAEDGLGALQDAPTLLSGKAPKIQFGKSNRLDRAGRLSETDATRIVPPGDLRRWSKASQQAYWCIRVEHWAKAKLPACKAACSEAGLHEGGDLRRRLARANFGSDALKPSDYADFHKLKKTGWLRVEYDDQWHLGFAAVVEKDSVLIQWGTGEEQWISDLKPPEYRLEPNPSPDEVAHLVLEMIILDLEDTEAREEEERAEDQAMADKQAAFERAQQAPDPSEMVAGLEVECSVHGKWRPGPPLPAGPLLDTPAARPAPIADSRATRRRLRRRVEGAGAAGFRKGLVVGGVQASHGLQQSLWMIPIAAVS